MTEEQIIEKAKQGDRKALAELVSSYEKTVFNFAFKVCRDREKAENTMQETFLNVLRKLDQFDGKSKFSTWLYRIVVNNCLMEARKNKKHTYLEPDEDENVIDDNFSSDRMSIPEVNIENVELRSILDESIKKLSYDYRTVFILRDVEQLSTEETADVLGLSVPAVKSRLHRARAFLRNEISGALKQ